MKIFENFQIIQINQRNKKKKSKIKELDWIKCNEWYNCYWYIKWKDRKLFLNKWGRILLIDDDKWLTDNTWQIDQLYHNKFTECITAYLEFFIENNNQIVATICW